MYTVTDLVASYFNFQLPFHNYRAIAPYSPSPLYVCPQLKAHFTLPTEARLLANIHSFHPLLHYVGDTWLTARCVLWQEGLPEGIPASNSQSMQKLIMTSLPARCYSETFLFWWLETSPSVLKRKVSLIQSFSSLFRCRGVK